MPTSERHLIHNAARAPCAVCGEEGLPCARCRVDYYCGKDHQRQDWPRHRAGCGVLQLREDERLGRHLVAARDIPAGTVVMRELPLLTSDGPLTAPRGFKCVSCYRALDAAKLGRRGADGWQQCAGCGWPTCGETCSLQERHLPECKAFQRANFKLGKCDGIDRAMRECLMALRACLAVERQPRLLDLQAALPPLPAKPLMPMPPTPPELGGPAITPRGVRTFSIHLNKYVDYRQLKRGHVQFSAKMDEIVDWLRNRAGLKWLSSADLKRGAGLFILNCIIVGESAKEQPSVTFAGVYAGLSVLEHSCISNLVHCAGRAPGEVLVLAARDVARGEHLSLDYGNKPLLSREARREMLCWRGFVCCCALCEDPTERGVFLSSWCCQRCAAAGKQSMQARPIDALQWTCSECGECFTACGLDDGLPLEVEPREELMKLLLGQDVRESALEDFVRRRQYPRGPLHATQYLILWAKERILGLPVKPVKRPEDLAALERRASYCEDLLQVLDRLGSHGEYRRKHQMTMFDLLRRQLNHQLPARLRDRKREARVMKELTALVQTMDNPVFALVGKDSLDNVKDFYERLSPAIASMGMKPHQFHF